MSAEKIFNPPPGWPTPPPGWKPPAGWTPEPSWPDPPEGWVLWLDVNESAQTVPPPPPPPAGTQEDPQLEPPSAEEHEAELPPPVATEPDPVLTATEPAPTFATAVPAQASVEERIAQLEEENARLRSAGGADDAIELNDEAVLQSVGIYRYHHPLETAAAFKERLNELDGRIKALVKDGRAIEASNMFTFDNSLAKGRKMTSDLSKLMLRAYNAEAENSIRTLRVGNALTAKKRLDRSRDSIAKLGKMMEMHISDEFHQLRFEEIELTSDYLMMKQEEKEAAKEERARLREEKKAQQELEAQRQELEKEREHHLSVIAALKAQGADTSEAEAKLAEVDKSIEDNDFRAANIRAGYVYVISNVGAFGQNVVKIGLTRRLEPLDRVRELGGASVPFRFDVHALFFSDDAVTLETELHHHFADRALNKMNARKEFFFATPDEVRQVLEERVGNLLEFNEHPEATEYFQSVSSWPEAA